MRVVIEIDGTPVVASEVSGSVAGSGDKRIEMEPPAELLRAAKALGAENAGSAKYVRSAGAADFRSNAIAAAQIAASGERNEEDAGRAAAIAKAPKKVIARRATRRRAK